VSAYRTIGSGSRRCAACTDDARPGEAFCGLHRLAFLARYGIRAVEQAQEEKRKRMKTKRDVQVVDTKRAREDVQAAEAARLAEEERAAEEREVAERAKAKRDKAAKWKFAPRDPEDRVRDVRAVRKLWERFLEAASVARVDYGRLGVDEQVVAGMLEQLRQTAFGDGSEGAGFRAVAKPPSRNPSRYAASLFEGAVVRFKKASEQAEVREDAGDHPITVVHVGPAFVRVACGAITYTAKANQIELDPDATQPPRPGERADDAVETSDEQEGGGPPQGDVVPGIEHYADEPVDEDDVPFGHGQRAVGGAA
jgi:hypothetical protein